MRISSPDFQVGAEQIGGTLQNDRVRPVFLADAEATILQDIIDLADGPVVVVTEIPDHHIRLVHKYARPDLQCRRIKPWINIGKIIVSADRDLGDVLLGEAEETCRYGSRAK